MGLGRQLRDPVAITVAALAAGAAWAVGVRPPAAGALGLAVLTVNVLTGLTVTGHAAAETAADEPLDTGPHEPIASPAAAAAGTTEPGDAGDGSDDHVFRREGEYWRIGSGEAVFSLKDSKGLRDLHCLLSNPGQEVYAVQLFQEGSWSGRFWQGPGLPEGFISDGGDLPVLDATAKAQYRQRMHDLEAKAFNDEGRVDRIYLEIDALNRRILEAIGIGGKDRPDPREVRRAANNVTRRIKGALEKIEVHDAALAHRLKASVERGIFCVYNPKKWPGPGQSPRWRL
jgi:hypothetical protein